MACAVEGLFAPQLQGRLRLHHTTYGVKSRVGPRDWITLDGDVIWDFPDMFSVRRAAENPHIHRDHLVETGWGWAMWKHETPELLGAYLDTPRDELFEPIHADYYGLGNILRAADRRIGFGRLAWWSFTTLSHAPAAKAVMGVRFAHMSRPRG